MSGGISGRGISGGGIQGSEHIIQVCFCAQSSKIFLTDRQVGDPASWGLPKCKLVRSGPYGFMICTVDGPLYEQTSNRPRPGACITHPSCHSTLHGLIESLYTAVRLAVPCTTFDRSKAVKLQFHLWPEFRQRRYDSIELVLLQWHDIPTTSDIGKLPAVVSL